MKKILLSLALAFFIAGYSFGQMHSDALAYAGTGYGYNSYGLPDSGPGDDPSAQVSFYPNPVKDYLNVRFPVKGNYTVKIYNIIGEKMAERSVEQDDLVRINLAELPNGVFFVSYEYGGRVATKTFSKSQ